jgi:hypothetical protein
MISDSQREPVPVLSGVFSRNVLRTIDSRGTREDAHVFSDTPTVHCMRLTLRMRLTLAAKVDEGMTYRLMVAG